MPVLSGESEFRRFDRVVRQGTLDVTSAGSPSIPLVDIAGLLGGDDVAVSRVTVEIADALERIGFFYLVGHGIDWSVVEDARQDARVFFTSSGEIKVAVEATRAGGPGYMAQADLYYREAGAPPAVNSAWAMLSENLGVNRWPDVPGFRESILRYHEAVEGLATLLLAPIGRGLGVADDHFAEHFKVPAGGVRLRYYPVCEYAANQWGLGAHSDQSFMTLLPDNDVPGLSIRIDAHRWIDAPSIPESFLVNSGTILRRWSNDRFLSTEHRVRNDSGIERIAMPYFSFPTVGTIVTPLPTCVSADRPARYPDLEFNPQKKADDDLELDPEASRPRAHMNYPDSGESTPDALPGTRP